MSTFQEQLHNVHVHYQRLMDTWDGMSVDERDKYMEDLRESIDELDQIHCSHESRNCPSDMMYWMLYGLMLYLMVLYYKTVLGWVLSWGVSEL
jgi:hypothetical protein